MIVAVQSNDEPTLAPGQSDAANLSGVVSRMRSRDEAASAGATEVDLSNVVPFSRASREAAVPAPAIAVSAADRFAGALSTGRGRLALFVVCSIAAHIGLYLPFAREPEPMTSIGEIAITAEIVLGTNTPAGNAAQSGDAETSTPTPAQDPNPQPEAKPEPEAAQTEPPNPEPQAVPTEPQETAALPSEEPPTVKPQVPVEPVPETQEAPAEIQAAPQQPAAAELQAAGKPGMSVEFKPAPPVMKPQQKTPREARKPAAKPETPKRVERRVASRGERNESRSTAPASSTASGVGRGRSDLNTNYRGLVAAHLARFKQFPADARSRGENGRAMVAFSLSGSGGVTSVRLVRGTGVGSLDQEATAMVRRASPFPAPPDHRSVSFTVPVSFRIQ